MKKISAYPNRDMFRVFSFLAAANLVFINEVGTRFSEKTSLTLTIVFAAGLAVTSSCLLLTTNLVYLDCYPENFTMAVTFSNFLRGRVLRF